MPNNEPLASSPKSLPALPLVVAAGIVALGLGGLGGYWLGSRTSADQYKAGHDAGLNEAKQKVDAAGLFSSPGGMTVISGTVENVSGDSLTVRVPQTVRNPLAQPAPELRTVKLGEGAKVVTIGPKDAATQKKELDAYNEAQKRLSEALMAGERNPPPPPAPPTPFAEQEIKFSDIAKGASVTIESGSDLTSAETITAKVIRIQPSAPPTPTTGRAMP